MQTLGASLMYIVLASQQYLIAASELKMISKYDFEEKNLDQPG